MTRREYIGKMRVLLIATYNHQDTVEEFKAGIIKKNALGKAFKYLVRDAKKAAKGFGSYEAAWESTKPCREYYMGKEASHDAI